MNPLFDEENNTIPEDEPYSDLVDGFAHRDLGEVDSHPGFPLHRTYSGSTTEGSYRPGSFEYLSEPEMKRSSVCSNSSGPSSSRNQSQESLRNFGASSDDERLLGSRDVERFSSTDSVNYTCVTNPSLEAGAERTLDNNRDGVSGVNMHTVNGDMAASKESALLASGAAIAELNSQPQR